MNSDYKLLCCPVCGKQPRITINHHCVELICMPWWTNNEMKAHLHVFTATDDDPIGRAIKLWNDRSYEMLKLRLSRIIAPNSHSNAEDDNLYL